MKTYNFVLDKIQYGTHQIPWDLSIYLYAGASLESRNTVAKSIQENKYGDVCQNRVEFISNLFDYFEYKSKNGSSRETIVTYLESLCTFIKWCDSNKRDLSINSFPEDYIAWANAEKLRARDKGLNEYTTQRTCRTIANILAKSQGNSNFPNSSSLILRTQFNSKPSSRKSNDKVVSNKQITEFGGLLKAIIEQLTIETIRGELPIFLRLPNDKEIILRCGFNGSQKDLEDMGRSEKKRYLKFRKPLEEHENILDFYRRILLVNLRVEAELYLFISQSNMNLSQALSLKQTEFRMMLLDDEYEVFTVYKNRKQGEATFRCYKDYRIIFLNYLQWLKGIGFTYEDSLFPLIVAKKSISLGKKAQPERIKNLCSEANIPYISSQKLRTFKSNWLFKHSDDSSVIVELMSHDKKTFENYYHKQSKLESMRELAKYNSQDLVKLTNGLCATNRQYPEKDETIETNILLDCSNPDGCLFCKHHRDVRSYDFIFKLISHRYLKKLELVLNPFQGNHPGKDIIIRIEEKIEHLKQMGDSERKWIEKAEASVLSGDYHSDWRDYILELEEIS